MTPQELLQELDALKAEMEGLRAELARLGTGRRTPISRHAKEQVEDRERQAAIAARAAKLAPTLGIRAPKMPRSADDDELDDAALEFARRAAKDRLDAANHRRQSLEAELRESLSAPYLARYKELAAQLFSEALEPLLKIQAASGHASHWPTAKHFWAGAFEGWQVLIEAGNGVPNARQLESDAREWYEAELMRIKEPRRLLDADAHPEEAR